ncbi:MAG: cell wall-active antibiotics response protein, partial [Lachnospiraceae bacterium]|nr:cell wall-active antibiotics response protein [Lachnospiraceae bacterium]
AIFMVALILWGLVNMTFGAVFFPLAVLCIIFKEPLGIENLVPWTVLIVAALFTAAMNVIIPSAKRNRTSFNLNMGGKSTTSEVGGNSEYIYQSTSFSEATKYIRSKNLSKVDLNVKFGEMSVYFDDAYVPSGEVTIDCNTSFGQMNVYIPRDWYVDNRATAALGEVDDYATKDQGDPEGVRCIITGSAFCGELELRRI